MPALLFKLGSACPAATSFLALTAHMTRQAKHMHCMHGSAGKQRGAAQGGRCCTTKTYAMRARNEEAGRASPTALCKKPMPGCQEYGSPDATRRHSSKASTVGSVPGHCLHRLGQRTAGHTRRRCRCRSLRCRCRSRPCPPCPCQPCPCPPCPCRSPCLLAAPCQREKFGMLSYSSSVGNGDLQRDAGCSAAR